ncbi:hypothetical protein H2248_004340 [Termitomyces sp. 'cryptogamus']|nr:hypothetical protein H2248_004340 [Termitomyces sp. 'cryptogamus']
MNDWMKEAWRLKVVTMAKGAAASAAFGKCGATTPLMSSGNSHTNFPIAPIATSNKQFLPPSIPSLFSILTVTAKLPVLPPQVTTRAVPNSSHGASRYWPRCPQRKRAA